MTEPCCAHGEPKKKKPPFSFSQSVAVVFVLTMLCSGCIPALASVREHTLMYLRQVGWAIALGFLLGGMLDRYVPREYVSHLLSRPRKRSILYSVLLGFLMSACSHGILALSVELHKKGASTPVVISFLLASPWANLPVTLMLLGFFGVKALFIIIGALVVAFTTGLAFQWLERRKWVETNRHTVEVAVGYSVLKDLALRFKKRRTGQGSLRADLAHILKASLSLADMTLGWILLGILLSSVAGAFVPEGWFRHWMGPTALGLLATLGLATVLEVCSEGTAPLAFELYSQTGAFGNALVFLMAGVATDFTEISVVAGNIGRRAALWMPLIAVPQIIVLGIIANRLF